MIKALLVLSLVAISLAVNIPWINGKAQLLHGDGEIIPGEYLVIFKEGISHDLSTEHINELKATYNIEHEWGFAEFHGFGATLTDDEVDSLRADTMVQFIEHNQMVYAIGGAEEEPEPELYPCSSGSVSSSLWGLARTSQRGSSYSTTTEYYDSSSSRTPAAVYILDTGIRTTHQTFGGRAYFAANYAGGGNTDGNGHGTHCAGTAVGSNYGVAKRSLVYNVKVLTDSGSGSTTGVVNGVNYVANQSRGQKVGSMSLGGGASTAMDNAVNSAYSAGVVMVVAAGNSNANACNYSPARATNAITVASISSNNAKSSFSNYGSCCDVNAPGSSILSAWYTSDTATNTISGTSMACPHVAGVAAALWMVNPSSTASQIRSELLQITTRNVVTGLPSGTPNYLAYNGCN